ncbi:right-handed parallel beta-helix repeat-containing protein [Algoriphagus pacificus]|uniref:Right-handed parallel beta-helix repeat-containing protein n=1 Tax=Algoriphagus pacificus TaxID=2811234 RepID=A0ABS3CKF7_9BACT|nr:right-handed parallel beta-helix repeat-containing protein [Algoriphagus pacificus]MBN7817578.1 right-handed parallel beta-helix repeat-containing protein [Algoriphagus pacificus]
MKTVNKSSNFFSVIIFLIILSTQAGYSQKLNILVYGADPSGVSDNTGIINALIDSLSKGDGGTVIIPEGKYLLHDALILKSNVSIEGEGVQKTILFRNPEVGNWNSSKSQAIITTDPSVVNESISVSNLSIEAAYKKKELKAKGGICLRNCTNSKISKVETSNTWHGVAFYDFKGANSGNIIQDVTSLNAHAFTTENNSGRSRGILTTDFGTKVINSTSKGAGTGFYANGKDISFEGCRAENWFEDNGYYLIVDNLIVKDCIAKGGPSPEKGFGSGFAIAYKKNGLIQNSQAINCSNYGFRIHVPQSDTKLINNEAIGCGIGFGIETASHPFPEVSERIEFTNNVAEKSGLYGFLFRQMSNSKVVGNKAINGNQRGLTLSTRGAIALKEYLSNNEFSKNNCIDNQAMKTQLFGIYDYSVDQISSASKKGKNNKISHKSSNGKDVF